MQLAQVLPCRLHKYQLNNPCATPAETSCTEEGCSRRTAQRTRRTALQSCAMLSSGHPHPEPSFGSAMTAWPAGALQCTL
jgi:hypothetical protein